MTKAYVLLLFLLSLVAVPVTAQTNVNLLSKPVPIDQTQAAGRFARLSFWYASHGIRQWTDGVTKPVPSANDLSALPAADVLRWRQTGAWSNAVPTWARSQQQRLVVIDRAAHPDHVRNYTLEGMFKTVLQNEGVTNVVRGTLEALDAKLAQDIENAPNDRTAVRKSFTATRLLAYRMQLEAGGVDIYRPLHQRYLTNIVWQAIRETVPQRSP